MLYDTICCALTIDFETAAIFQNDDDDDGVVMLSMISKKNRLRRMQ